MKAEFPEAKITYVPGTEFLSDQADLVPVSVLTTPDGKPGLKAEYGSRASFEAKPTPITSSVESTVNLTAGSLPAQAKEIHDLSVEWTGFLNPKATGDYLIGIKVDGFGRLLVDGKLITMLWGKNTNFGQVHLEKGQPVKLDVSYGRNGASKPEVQLLWALVNNAPNPAAIAAAKNADVVVAVVGITSRLEGEEMPVDQPAFPAETVPVSICPSPKRIWCRPWLPLASRL